MKNGQVFTPNDVVCFMLDVIGYKNEDIMNSTIFEPSFGEGAFLIEIVGRIIEYYKSQNYSDDVIIKALDNVYGYELDKDCYDRAITNLNSLLDKYNLKFCWTHLVCGDALACDTSMLYDYIVGNPPYIRVHEFSDEVKSQLSKFSMCTGNTDLYIIFIEHCLNLLSLRGKLCFITPNSFLCNNSQKNLRKKLTELRIMDSIWNFGSLRLFKANTYTAITLIDRQHNSSNLHYYSMSSLEEINYNTVVDLDSYKGKPWKLCSKEDTGFLNIIYNRTQKLGDMCDIQQGLETNLNSVYIIDEEKAKEFKYQGVQKAVKGSTLGEGKFIIFPYEYTDVGCRLLTEERFKELAPDAYGYLLKFKEKLLQRDLDSNMEWFGYARQQGLKNGNKTKIAVKHYLSKGQVNLGCKLYDCDTYVHSGIYITAKDGYNIEEILEIVKSDELCKYLYLVGKDCNSEYKIINTKLLKDYGVK